MQCPNCGKTINHDQIIEQQKGFIESNGVRVWDTTWETRCEYCIED